MNTDWTDRTDWHGFRMVIVLLVAGWLLTACREPDEVVTVNTPQATTAVPTATNTPLPPTVTTTATSLPRPATLTPRPTDTARPTVTPSPTPSETPTPAATPVPREEILTQFPLYPGQIRVYRVTFTDEAGQADENQARPTTWTGLVTETITTVQEVGSDLVFEAAVQGMPDHFDGEAVILSDTTVEYVVDNNGIWRDGLKLVQFPLEVDASWPAVAEDSSDAAWLVTGQEDVAAPAGFFSGCWNLTLQTELENSQMTFCPGAGIVSWDNIRQGETDIQSWVLYWMGEL